MSVVDYAEVLKELDAVRTACTVRIDAIASSIAPWTPKEYAGEVMVPAHTTVTLNFGEEFEVPGSMYPGLPESAAKMFGVLNDFRADTFRVDEGKELLIHGLFFANKALWTTFNAIPTERFMDPNVVNLRGERLQRGLTLTAQIANPTDHEILFKARLIGQEKILPTLQAIQA